MSFGQTLADHGRADNANVTICREEERQSVTAEIFVKNITKPAECAVARSRYPGSEWRPHPYQLMQEVFLAYFLPFPALLSREKMVLGGYISVKSIRFYPRVGQIVGQKASERILEVFYPRRSSPKSKLAEVSLWETSASGK